MKHRSKEEIGTLKLLDDLIKPPNGAGMVTMRLDGKHVAETAVSYGGDNRITVWDAEEWLEKHRFAPINGLSTMCFDFYDGVIVWGSRSDNNLFLSTTSGLDEAKFKWSNEWDNLETATVLPARGGTPTQVVAGSHNRLAVYDIKTGQVISSMPLDGYKYPIMLRALPGKPNLIAGQMQDGRIIVWDVTTWGSLRSDRPEDVPTVRVWKGPDRSNWYPILDVNHSNPSYVVATGCNKVCVFDMDSGNEVPLWEVDRSEQREYFHSASLYGNVLAGVVNQAVTHIYDIKGPSNPNPIIEINACFGAQTSAVVIDAEQVVSASGCGFAVAKYHDWAPIVSREPLPQEICIPQPRSVEEIKGIQVMETPISGPKAPNLLLDGNLHAKTAVSASQDGCGGFITLWNAENWTVKHKWERIKGKDITDVDYYGNLVAWVQYGDPYMYIGNTNTLGACTTLNLNSVPELNSLKGVAIMRTDGSPTLAAACMDEQIIMTDIETGRLITRLKFPAPKPGWQGLTAMTGQNNVVLALAGDHTVKAFDLNVGTVKPIRSFIGTSEGFQGVMNTILVAPETNWGQFMHASAFGVGMFDFAGKDKPYWRVTDKEDPDIKKWIHDATTYGNVLAFWTDCGGVGEPKISLYDLASAPSKIHSFRTNGYSFRMAMDYDRLIYNTYGPDGWWVASFPQ